MLRLTWNLFRTCLNLVLRMFQKKHFFFLLWWWARERVRNLQKPQGTLYHDRDVRTSLIHG